MKILFIIDSLIKGGKERRFVELLKGIDRTDTEYKYLLLTDINEFVETQKLREKPLVIKRKIKKDPSVFLKLTRICRKFKPDIINAWGLMPAFYSFPVAAFLKIKFVNSMIIDAPKKLDMRTRILSKPILLFSDLIVSNSYAGLESYGIRSDKTRVISNGFDSKRLENLKNESEIRDDLGVRTRYSAVMVAAFRCHKDYKTMVSAARSVLSSRNDVTFIFVGDGPDLQSTKDEASGYDRIIFTGKRSDVESIINMCDIGLLSTYTEGISNSIMEYMALGKPVVATSGGGTKELIDEGETGFLVPERSPDVFSNKIMQLLENNELREKMGSSGRVKIEKYFSINKMISDYISIFKEISDTNTMQGK